jgi:hypothetical protein
MTTRFPRNEENPREKTVLWPQPVKLRARTQCSANDVDEKREYAKIRRERGVDDQSSDEEAKALGGNGLGSRSNTATSQSRCVWTTRPNVPTAAQRTARARSAASVSMSKNRRGKGRAGPARVRRVRSTHAPPAQGAGTEPPRIARRWVRDKSDRTMLALPIRKRPLRSQALQERWTKTASGVCGRTLTSSNFQKSRHSRGELPRRSPLPDIQCTLN